MVSLNLGGGGGEGHAYGGPQLSQQQQITRSTNEDIHSNNNNSQHKPRYSQQKENCIDRTGIRNPRSLGPLRPRGHPLSK